MFRRRSDSSMIWFQSSFSVGSPSLKSFGRIFLTTGLIFAWNSSTWGLGAGEGGGYIADVHIPLRCLDATYSDNADD